MTELDSSELSRDGHAYQPSELHLASGPDARELHGVVLVLLCEREEDDGGACIDLLKRRR